MTDHRHGYDEKYLQAEHDLLFVAGFVRDLDLDALTSASRQPPPATLPVASVDRMRAVRAAAEVLAAFRQAAVEGGLVPRSA